MKNFFQNEYEIKYSDCDKNGNILLTRLLSYAQEASTLHTDLVGCTFNYMIDNKIGWILLENYSKVNSYPKLGDKIIVKTWLNPIEKLFIIRNYVIEDINGNILFESYTKWIMYSFEKMRPIHIPIEVENMYSFDEKKGITFEDFDFSRITDYDNIFSNVVIYGDIDTNWHMNNIAYVIKAIDTMTIDFLESHIVNDILVRYNHQLVYKDKYAVQVKKIDNNKYAYIINGNNNDTSKNNADIIINWRKK
ncbi:MAG: thioesterase [Clostridia bacterium]|nr:thioesterase [Clostridia bacterium]